MAGVHKESQLLSIIFTMKRYVILRIQEKDTASRRNELVKTGIREIGISFAAKESLDKFLMNRFIEKRGKCRVLQGFMLQLRKIWMRKKTRNTKTEIE